MISILLSNKNLIAFAVILTALAGLYFYIHSLKSDIRQLSFKLEQSKTELANVKLEAARYKNALDRQSEKVDAMKSELSKKTKVLVKWKTLPPKIKYKTIVKIREIKGDDCEQIKAKLTAVKSIDFSSL